jgi:hypothetical protein
MSKIIEHVKQTLEENNLKYTVWQGEERIRFELVFSGRGTSFMILINCKEDGKMLHLLAPKLAIVSKDNPNAKEVYAQILSWNYEYWYPKFSIDEDDGEIVVEAALPLPEDGIFPAKALGRVLAGMAGTLFETYPTLLETVYGQASGEQSLTDAIFVEIIRGITENQDEEGSEGEA